MRAGCGNSQRCGGKCPDCERYHTWSVLTRELLRLTRRELIKLTRESEEAARQITTYPPLEEHTKDELINRIVELSKDENAPAVTGASRGA